MATDPPTQPGKALGSWKEIARFFEREVRTVQRWEKEEGLPVHRHRHQRQSSVYAFPEELDAWWRKRGNLPEDSPDSVAEAVAAPQATPKTAWRAWAGIAAVLIIAVVAGVWGVTNFRRSEEAPPFHTVVFEANSSDGLLHRPLAGDVNGDGVDDILVSAWNGREAYVVFGRSSGSGGGPLSTVSNVVFQLEGKAQIGIQQTADFNGDGIHDLLFSEYLYEPESYTATGKSYLVWGRTRWPGRLKMPEAADVTLGLDWPTDARMGGCAPEGSFLDLNGDGIDDVLLGAVDYGFGEKKSAGAVFVLWGRKQWEPGLEVSQAANLVVRGSRTGEGLGAMCVLGDLDGDERQDLVVHASEVTLWKHLGGRGRHYVFYGRESWPRGLEAESESDFAIQGEQPQNTSTTTLLADVNGDRRADLVAGWPITQMPDPAVADKVRIWFGGTRRQGMLPAGSADVTIRGPRESMLFGGAMAARDFDGDGILDLVVSEPRRSGVYLLYGRRNWQREGDLDDYAPVTLFRDGPTVANHVIATADTNADTLPEILFTTASWDPAAKPAPERLWMVEPYASLAIDVRPEKEENVILWPGVLVVRLPTESTGPEKAEVDPATLRLAGAPATHWMLLVGTGGPRQMQANFDTAKMKIDRSTRVVSLTARTRTGLPAGGSDVVSVVPTRITSEGRAPVGGAGANP